MLYGKYIFSCIFQDDAILPDYKGSTFRGVFGHALKKVVCALKREECSDCLLKTRCVYAFVFELQASDHDHLPDAAHESDARLPEQTSTRQRIAAPPHPYVIEPFNSSRTHYAKGEPFDFSLLLFGKTNDYLPYFIYAMDQMGKLGVGKANIRDAESGNPRKIRASFTLREVKANGLLVYNSAEGKIKAGDFTEQLSLTTASTDPCEGCTDIDITLLTPLRLKYENHLEAKLPFHVLVRAMLRRVSSLSQSYDDGEPHLDYRGLVERAKSVEISASSLHWYDWKRYSNRQDQAMLMGGIIGKVSYAGNLDEFLPLIHFCEKVHLGKQTAFGLGRIKGTV